MSNEGSIHELSVLTSRIQVMNGWYRDCFMLDELK